MSTVGSRRPALAPAPTWRSCSPPSTNQSAEQEVRDVYIQNSFVPHAVIRWAFLRYWLDLVAFEEELVILGHMCRAVRARLAVKTSYRSVGFYLTPVREIWVFREWSMRGMFHVPGGSTSLLEVVVRSSSTTTLSQTVGGDDERSEWCGPHFISYGEAWRLARSCDFQP